MRDALNGTLVNGRAYLREELPEHLHARRAARLGDVVALANEGWAIVDGTLDWTPPPGMHGWDPRIQSMHGIFLIAGPGIAAGQRLPRVESVHLYPLLAETLQLRPHAPIDGDFSVLGGLLERSGSATSRPQW